MAKAHGRLSPAGDGRWSSRRTLTFVLLACLLLWMKIAGAAWALAVQIMQVQELNLVSAVAAPLFHADRVLADLRPAAHGGRWGATLDRIWQRPIWPH